jgi:hypothetical protein
LRLDVVDLLDRDDAARAVANDDALERRAGRPGRGAYGAGLDARRPRAP